MTGKELIEYIIKHHAENSVIVIDNFMQEAFSKDNIAIRKCKKNPTRKKIIIYP
jgi:hypothetical protein